jgi:hypothetical protein
MKVLRYYYYRLYKYFSNGGNIPFFSTYILIIAFLFINFLSFVDLIYPFFGLGKLNFPANRFWSLLVIIPGFIIFNHVLKTMSYHDQIIAEFEIETKRSKNTSIVLVIVYFVFSMGFFAFSLWFREKLWGY